MAHAWVHLSVTRLVAKVLPLPPAALHQNAVFDSRTLQLYIKVIVISKNTVITLKMNTDQLTLTYLATVPESVTELNRGHHMN